MSRSSFYQFILLAILIVIGAGTAQTPEPNGHDQNPSIQRAIEKAKQYESAGRHEDAIGAYKKANKVAGGKCSICLLQLSEIYGVIGDQKNSAKAATQLGEIVSSPADKATAATLEGTALLREGMAKKKRELFEQASAKFQLALQYQADRTDVYFLYGMALGRSGDDTAAKREFAKYVASKVDDPVLRARALKYQADPSLVRENLAPPFSIQTMQGESISLDNLQGRVMLLDFWATWCGPCNAELPQIQHLAKRFQGEPLVVLSVSIDKNSSEWRAFVNHHGMTWPQYWDGDGKLADSFGVRMIPHYFTIDAQGIMRSEDVGSGNDIEGRIAKLLAQARTINKQATSKSGADSLN